MDELKLGGFPPLLKKFDLPKESQEKDKLKPQFFSTNIENVNIREILNNNTKNILKLEDDSLEEVNNF